MRKEVIKINTKKLIPIYSFEELYKKVFRYNKKYITELCIVVGKVDDDYNLKELEIIYYSELNELKQIIKNLKLTEVILMNVNCIEVTRNLLKDGQLKKEHSINLLRQCIVILLGVLDNVNNNTEKYYLPKDIENMIKVLNVDLSNYLTTEKSFNQRKIKNIVNKKESENQQMFLNHLNVIKEKATEEELQLIEKYLLNDDVESLVNLFKKIDSRKEKVLPKGIINMFDYRKKG